MCAETRCPLTAATRDRLGLDLGVTAVQGNHHAMAWHRLRVKARRLRRTEALVAGDRGRGSNSVMRLELLAGAEGMTMSVVEA